MSVMLSYNICSGFTIDFVIAEGISVLTVALTVVLAAHPEKLGPGRVFFVGMGFVTPEDCLTERQ
jgi:hypothetical protein